MTASGDWGAWICAGPVVPVVLETIRFERLILSVQSKAVSICQQSVFQKQIAARHFAGAAPRAADM